MSLWILGYGFLRRKEKIVLKGAGKENGNYKHT